MNKGYIEHTQRCAEYRGCRAWIPYSWYLSTKQAGARRMRSEFWPFIYPLSLLQIDYVDAALDPS